MIDTLTLKKRIYDLAISGQLTRHLVDDTPVDTSLLSYQEEGVDSLPEIPDTWKYCYFDDVLINRDSERIPVSVADRKKLNKKYDYYGASGVIDKVDNFLFDENLLLIGEDGANLLSRSTPIAFIAKGKYWVNNHAHVLQATEHVLLEFIEIYINAISLVPYVTGSAQPKLSQHMMSKIPVPVPPIEEQQRIVETVRSVFEHLGLIDALQNQYKDNLATLKSKIIDAGIQGKLTEQLPEDGTAEELYQQIQQEKLALEKAGKIKKSKPLPPISEEEKPFDIPESWKWVRIGGIANAIYAGGDKPEDFSKVKDNTHLIPVVGNGVENEGILGYTGKPTAKAYTVTVAGRGTIGFSVFRQYEYCPVVRLIVIEQNANIDPRYIQYVLQALPESGVGSSIPQLTVPMLTPKVIPLPPLAEQKRIVAKLEELLPLCD